MNLPKPIGRPAQIYRGDLLFYLAKVGLGIVGIFFMIVGTGASIAGTIVTLRAESYTVDILGMVVIYLAMLVNGLFLSVTFLHMYPEVGISETHFWFRHFGIWNFGAWHSIPWGEISEVRLAKTLFITQGLVVYSPKLPFYYWFYGRAYGRKAGRALLIPNQLNRMDELKAQLQSYGRFSVRNR